MNVPASYRLPRLPSDPQDDEGDREANQRIRDRSAERNDSGARDDGQRNVGVSAGMVSVGNQRRASKRSTCPATDDARKPVAREADRPGYRQSGKVIGCL